MKNSRIRKLLVGFVVAVGILGASQSVFAGASGVGSTVSADDITQPVTKKKTLRLNKKNKIYLTKGQTCTLRLKGKKIKLSKIKWRSRNRSVATVKRGVVKAKRLGKTTVVAVYKNKKYKCTVIVEPASAHRAREMNDVTASVGKKQKDGSRAVTDVSKDEVTGKKSTASVSAVKNSDATEFTFLQKDGGKIYKLTLRMDLTGKKSGKLICKFTDKKHPGNNYTAVCRLYKNFSGVHDGLRVVKYTGRELNADGKLVPFTDSGDENTGAYTDPLYGKTVEAFRAWDRLLASDAKYRGMNLSMRNLGFSKWNSVRETGYSDDNLEDEETDDGYVYDTDGYEYVIG